MAGAVERKKCIDCGNPVRSKGRDKHGARRWCTRCGPCHRRRYISAEKNREYKRRSTPRTRYLGKTCNRCGFVPEHLVQLHLDHIDGNHANNARSNLQTLCANCHALKTEVNGDYLTPSRGPRAPLSLGDGKQESLFTVPGVGGRALPPGYGEDSP